jgi:DNA-binding GntR family transcriptional regulator
MSADSHFSAMLGASDPLVILTDLTKRGHKVYRAPLQVSSVVDAVEASLRDQILNLSIPGGSPVRETDVAKAFEVARPTAKAAIERLVAAGLLRRESRRSSAVVSALAADDVADLYHTRAVIESEFCRRLAVGRRLPPGCRETIVEMRMLTADASPGSFVEPDIKFHKLLAEYTECRRLTRIHAALMQEMHLCMVQVQAYRLLSPDVIISEHVRIADAIEAGDSETAVRIMQQHLDAGRNVLVDFLNAKKEQVLFT